MSANREKAIRAAMDRLSWLPAFHGDTRLVATEIVDAVLAVLSPAEPSKPPREFWREVPCGHPPDPVAWVGPDGAVCHCGWGLDPADSLPVWNPAFLIVPCGKCGCAVGIPKAEPSPAEPERERDRWLDADRSWAGRSASTNRSETCEGAGETQGDLTPNPASAAAVRHVCGDDCSATKRSPEMFRKLSQSEYGFTAGGSLANGGLYVDDAGRVVFLTDDQARLYATSPDAHSERAAPVPGPFSCNVRVLAVESNTGGEGSTALLKFEEGGGIDVRPGGRKTDTVRIQFTADAEDLVKEGAVIKLTLSAVEAA